MKEYLLMFKNTFKFSGKSSRREFWVAMVFNAIMYAILFLMVLPFVWDFDLMLSAYFSLTTLYEIFTFIPMLSLTVRRLHDVGRSGWYVLISLTFIGTIFLLIWLIQPSEFRVNAWYAGYKNNSDEIKMEDEQNAEYQTAQQVETNSQGDSIEKIIAELNELKRDNKISQQEYDDLMSKLTKK